MPTTTSREPLVSVIVPVYNVKATLARCIDSIKTQTYQNLEIILIDDGSIDGSGELCTELASRDQRIQVLHQKNQGLSAARNTGLDHATGAYITFVDSDDTIASTLVADLLQIALTDKVDFVTCSFNEIYAHTIKPFTKSSSIPRKYLTIDGVIHMLQEDGFTMSAWGKLYARHLFNSVRFPVGKLYEDVGTTYRLLLQCSKITFLPRPLYNYYQTSSSIIHQDFSFAKLDLITLTDTTCDQIARELINDSVRPVSPEQQSLIFALKRRRMHARFSILRQMVTVKVQALPTAEQQRFRTEREAIVNYLRAHRNDILSNPLSSKRDRLAMYSLLCGLPAFSFAWKLYQHQKRV